MTYEEANKAIQEIINKLHGNENIRLFTLLADTNSNPCRMLFLGWGCQACGAEVIMDAYSRKILQHEDEVQTKH